MKRLLIVLVPFALAGCVTEQAAPTLPMALGPAETAKATCLTYGDTPTFGDCETSETVTVMQE
jgi:hypothetical protein